MKVFLSWSGNRSRAVAELLNEWISCVLQAAQPWISTHDIGSGTIWFSEIQTQLAETSVGVVCLTRENKTKPWILFEAGALAKGISSSRVCTFLIDLAHSEVENPLAQFNHTLPTEQGLRQLTQTLNVALPTEHRLRPEILDKVFATYWPQFEAAFAKILEAVPIAAENVPARTEQSMLVEILENSRLINNRVNELERRAKVDASSTILNTLYRNSVDSLNPYTDKVNGLLELAIKGEDASDSVRVLTPTESKEILSALIRKKKNANKPAD